jgi:hypothetical protein
MRHLLKQFQASLSAGIMLVGLLTLVAACSNRKIVQVGSHTITVSRHGFEKKFYVNERASEPTFEYTGMSTAGDGLKVTIKGDKVNINGVDRGKLRAGDTVLISDDGVAVNSLDYGESEKYLRANSTSPDLSGLD